MPITCPQNAVAIAIGSRDITCLGAGQPGDELGSTMMARSGYGQKFSSSDGWAISSITPRQNATGAIAFKKCLRIELGGWDYRWTFACWIRSGLSIHPLVNLVSNIGFNGDATHTTIKNHLADLPLETIELPLKHPPFVLRDAQFDKLLQTHVYQMKWRDRWTYRVRAEGVWRTLAYLWGKFLTFKKLSMQK
jgi:hypothetical protein